MRFVKDLNNVEENIWLRNRFQSYSGNNVVFSSLEIDEYDGKDMTFEDLRVHYFPGYLKVGILMTFEI